jgi:hypothetical protein
VTVICNEPLELGTFRFGTDVDYKRLQIMSGMKHVATLQTFRVIHHKFNVDYVHK